MSTENLDRAKAALEHLLEGLAADDPYRELLEDYRASLQQPAKGEALSYLQEVGAGAALPHLEDAVRSENSQRRRELIGEALEALSQAE